MVPIKVNCFILRDFIRRWPLLTQGVVLVLLSLVYYGTGKNPKVFDSLSHIRAEEFTAQALNNFSLSFWLGKRAITSTTYFLNYYFFGDNLSLINAVNLMFHFFCSLTIFAVLKKLFDNSKNRVAHFSSLIFFIHPVTTYASLYHIQRSIIIATLFSMLSILFYLEYIKNYKKTWGLLTIAFYLLALQSKEHCVMLPFFLVCISYCKNKENIKSFVTKQGWVFASLGILALYCVFLNSYVIASSYENWAGSIQQQLNPLAADQITSSTLTEDFVYARSVINQAYLYFKYLFLLAFPVTYFMSIDIPEVFPAHVLQIPQILIAPFFFAIPFIIFYLNKKIKKPEFLLCLLYPWILFLTELSTVRFHEIFVLYRSYIWLGLFVAVPVYLIFLLKPFLRNSVLVLYLAFVFFGLYNRKATFADKVLVWEDAASIALRAGPNAGSAYRPLVHLGGYYALNHRFEEAIQAFNEAIRLNPTFYLSYYNLGNVYGATKNHPMAIAAFQKSLKYSPQDLQSYIELINLYLLTQSPNEAILACNQARLLGLNNIRLKTACGSALFMNNNFEMATTEFQSVLIDEPNNIVVRINLAGALIKLEKYASALSHLQFLYLKDPQSRPTLHYLALVYKRLGDQQKFKFFSDLENQSPAVQTIKMQ